MLRDKINCFFGRHVSVGYTKYRNTLTDYCKYCQYYGPGTYYLERAPMFKPALVLVAILTAAFVSLIILLVLGAVAMLDP